MNPPLLASKIPGKDVQGILRRLVAGVPRDMDGLPERAEDRVHDIRVRMKKFRAVLRLPAPALQRPEFANSDNVVRAGLTPKFKDVGTLCDILTYECGAPAILRPASDGRITEYAAPVPEFSLTRRRMKQSEHVGKSGRTGVEILLITEGAVTIRWSNACASFTRGDAVILPAALASYELRSESDSELFSVTIP